MHLHRGMMCLPLAAVLFGPACLQQPAEQPPPRLTVTVERDVLTADGLDHTRVTAHYAELDGVVVRFTASGGLLSQSAAVPVGGTAAVDLTADREEDLGRVDEKVVVVRAIVELTNADVVTATVNVTFRRPAGGTPLLFVEATPPAVVADGQATVELVATARRIPTGTTLQWSTTAGTLASATSVLTEDQDGTPRARVVLRASDVPANAQVTGVEPQSGATATATVAFVPSGAPQFDLTGTWGQLALARVRLTANTLRPSPQCVLAPSIMKVTITQRDRDVTAAFETCAVTLPPVTSIAGTVTNETPPPFLAAIPRVEDSFVLDSTVLGAVFAPPGSVVVVGAQLQNPQTDALPTEPEDGRVRDDDGDGEPGVTVINSLGGEQHVVYRNTGRARGLVLSSNRITGATLGDLTAITETSVFGLGARFVPVTTGIPSVTQFARVDGINGAAQVDANGDGTISCAEIVDAQFQIFDLMAPATPLDCGGL
jgi:hypothetical protein